MRSKNVKLTEFGKCVTKALIDRDMTKAELAAKVGMLPQELSFILNGKKPGQKYKPRIVAVLDLDPAMIETSKQD